MNFKSINVLFETDLMIAAKINDVTKLRECYDANLDSLNNINSSGESALIIAAKLNNVDNVIFLLSCPGVNMYVRDIFGNLFIDYVFDNYKSYGQVTISRILHSKKFLLGSEHTNISNLSNVTIAIISKIPYLTVENMDFEHRNILMNDEIEEFIRNLTFYNFSAFLLACQYNAVNIIRYCIEQEFGLNYLSTKRYSGLTYLVYNEQLELSQLYISKCKEIKRIVSTKDYYGKLPLTYNSSKTMNTLTLSLLSKIEHPEPDTHAFRHYKMSDFDIVDYKKSSRGSFGIVTHAIEKSTGLNVAIKSMINNGSEFGEDNVNNLLKEICYMKHINSHNKHITPEIYGIIYEDGKLKVVFEYLYSDLDELINILGDMSVSDKKPFIDDLMRNMLVIVDYLSSLGIVHGDVKPNNFMIDRNNRLKIIDFGLVAMYGINRQNTYDSKLSTIRYIYPPDHSGTLNIYKKNGTTKTIQCNGTTLNYDVFSLGVSFAHFIFGSPLNIFSDPQTGNILLDYEELNPYTSEKKCWLNLSPRKVIEFGGEDLWDLLKNMLSYDSSNRYYARECLQHKYFSGTDYTRPSHEPLMIIPNRKNYNRYSYNCPEQTVYFEEMHFNYIDGKLLDTSKPFTHEHVNMEMYYILMDWLFDVTKNFKIFTLDHIINLGNHIWRIILDDKENKIIRRTLQAYGCAVLFINDIQYLYKATSSSEIVNICDDAYTWKNLCDVFSDVITHEFILNITPVEIHLSYLIFKLQKINFDKIIDLEKYIIMNLIKWSIFNDAEQFTIWELICNLTHIFLSDNSIFNLEVTNLLTELDSDICTRIHYVISRTEQDTKIHDNVENMY